MYWRFPHHERGALSVRDVTQPRTVACEKLIQIDAVGPRERCRANVPQITQCPQHAGRAVIQGCLDTRHVVVTFLVERMHRPVPVFRKPRLSIQHDALDGRTNLGFIPWQRAERLVPRRFEKHGVLRWI